MKYETGGEYAERKVLDLLCNEDGLTDVEIAGKLDTKGFSRCTVFNICRQLSYKGLVKRKRIKGGVRNFYRPTIDGHAIYISESAIAEQMIISVLSKSHGMTDQQIKDKLNTKGLSSQFIQEVCKQLAYKGITKRVSVEGVPILNILV